MPLLRNNFAVSAILIVLVMTVLDVTIMNVALPVLANEFGVSDSSSVWLVTIYQLIITMLLLPLSSVGDLYSYKRTFLAGVVIFTTASLLCAAAPNFPMLIAARAVQGLGAACIMAVNIALTRLVYPKEIIGRGMALNAMVIAVATAAGPTIAGAILSIASWHWLFIINAPLGVIAFFIARKWLPANPPKKHAHKFDFVSALENCLTFGIIFLALGNLGHHGELIANLMLLATGLLIGFFYIRRQIKHDEPMLPVDLMRSRVYSLSIITSTFAFIAMNLALISLPFLFHNNYGFSSIITGLMMTPWSIATMLMSPIAARFVERHNPAMTAATGMAVYVFGVLLLLWLPQEGANEWQIAWRMAVCGLGFGIYQTPNNIVMMRATPIHRSGAAGGMQSTARLVGQTFGATLVSTVFASSFTTPFSVDACLYISLTFGAMASILSITRKLPDQ